MPRKSVAPACSSSASISTLSARVASAPRSIAAGPSVSFQPPVTSGSSPQAVIDESPQAMKPVPTSTASASRVNTRLRIREPLPYHRRPMLRRALPHLALLVLLSACHRGRTVPATSTEEAAYTTWKQQRLRSIAGEDGWITLVARAVLEEG